MAQLVIKFGVLEVVPSIFLCLVDSGAIRCVLEKLFAENQMLLVLNGSVLIIKENALIKVFFAKKRTSFFLVSRVHKVC